MSFFKSAFSAALVFTAIGIAATPAVAKTMATSRPPAAGPLAAFAPDDICRALVATIKDQPVSRMRTDKIAGGLVVAYTDKKNGPTHNVKCHVNTVQGVAQWASDSGPWHVDRIKIATNAKGDLIIQPYQSAAQTFSQAELAKKPNRP